MKWIRVMSLWQAGRLRCSFFELFLVLLQGLTHQRSVRYDPPSRGGLDHERVAFEHHGHPFRLTDVVREVVKEIIA